MLLLFSVNYILLCVLCGASVVWVVVKIIQEESVRVYRGPNSNNSDSDNDGGISEEDILPDLDLPPGVTLPIDGPRVEIEEEEEAFA